MEVLFVVREDDRNIKMEIQNLNQNNKEITHEIDNDKILAIIAYIFFPIPLWVVKNRSSFLNYHINQGLILFLLIIIGIFGLDFLPFWLGILTWFKGVWSVAMITLFVIGIKNVLNKKMEPLPVVGKLFTFLK